MYENKFNSLINFESKIKSFAAYKKKWHNNGGCIRKHNYVSMHEFYKA